MTVSHTSSFGSVCVFHTGTIQSDCDPLSFLSGWDLTYSFSTANDTMQGHEFPCAEHSVMRLPCQEAIQHTRIASHVDSWCTSPRGQEGTV